ncbi:hypothetical protein [Dactylosporangium sp. NPDC051541]|uniref:hypothetical protein n=1 Tax=Dactylosporangium sp. NPDC051541 TaxID=3363977 RepID=UPI00379D6DDB
MSPRSWSGRAGEHAAGPAELAQVAADIAADQVFKVTIGRAAERDRGDAAAAHAGMGAPSQWQRGAVASAPRSAVTVCRYGQCSSRRCNRVPL